MIKKDGSRYKLDVRIDGKRFIRLYDTKTDAIRALRDLNVKQSGDTALKQDTRKLSQLIDAWHVLHGINLKSSADTLARLKKLAISINDPVAKSMTSSILATYRASRLSNGIKASTLNREFITLKSMFRELKRMGVIDYLPAFLDVRKLKETRLELSYLSLNQVDTLLDECKRSKNDSLYYVVLICLSTGARWSEAETLRLENCKNNGFSFVDTKNGYSRYVPVSHSLFSLVIARLGRSHFTPCYSAYRSAFARCGFTVPTGQLAHIMRHTFASHFMMNGGNIIALQKILGHSSLNITMRYSHLSPDYLTQAVHLNPLALSDRSGKNTESQP